MAEKPVKSKQPEKQKAEGRVKEAPKTSFLDKAKAIVAKAPESSKDKDKERKPNRLVVWYRETIGELRKVSWPTPQSAWRLTYIVIIVMLSTSLVLGLLDFAFSRLVGLLVQL